MPDKDEDPRQRYDSIEDYLKTVEDSKYYHSLYLKAVNHPIRREILTVINRAQKISEKKLLSILRKLEVLDSLDVFHYNIDFLIKALCVKKSEEEGATFYSITQSGQVVEYLR